MTPSVDLPPPDARMTPGRKAAIVDAVKSGSVTLGEVCDRYNMGADEFLSWFRAKADHGQRGLRATRLHAYQPNRRRQQRSL